RASYNMRAYDLRFDNNGYDHSSSGYRLDAGVQMMFTPLIKGTVYLGYLQQNFNAPLSDVSGLDFGAQIDWYVTELVTVHFTAARTLTDTTIAGASSEDERSGQVSFDYELLRDLILQGNAGYEDDIFDGAARQDHIVTAGLGAKYLIDRHMNLYADYTHVERDTNAAGSDFTDNLFSAGIKFQY
ncbi:MAG TPA: outer membrane beta-barrel protein, partial [Rhizomicrobium sp.]